MSITQLSRANDVAAVREALVALVGPRGAESLIAASRGSAYKVLELARSRSGSAWQRLQAAQRLHELALLEVASKGPAMESPAVVRRFLSTVLATRPYEVFCVVFLDSRHRAMAMLELFRGTIDGAAVHPREVVREALAHNAAAVVLAHNHPSGVAEPSQADELITHRLREALALVEIRVLDHLIVSAGGCTSLAERGLL
jgi:DNA repair protein RadC